MAFVANKGADKEMDRKTVQYLDVVFPVYKTGIPHLMPPPPPRWNFAHYLTWW